MAAKNKRTLFLILRIEIWETLILLRLGKCFEKKIQGLVKAKALRLYSDTEK